MFFFFVGNDDVTESWLLVGGLEHGFYDFPYIGNVIIPTDEHIFFRGVGIPPTSESWLPSGYDQQFAMERSSMLLRGKPSINGSSIPWLC